jgi:glycosyltransferase involved in cell wall biosynthesis
VFHSSPVYLPPPNSFRRVFQGFLKARIIKSHKILLFSSLTPLENYLRYRLSTSTQVIGLWYTHKDGNYTNREIRALKRANVVFVHSANESEKISSVTNAVQVEMLAAIDPQRFSRPATFGSSVVWVGTPVERKRPELIIQLAKSLPKERFKIIGNGWRKSEYWSDVKKCSNILYIEFSGPLTSDQLDGADIYLMTSKIEGGPMPLMESIAAGLTPICTDTGFVKQIFQEMKITSQLIVEPDIQEIVSIIHRVRRREVVIPSDARDKMLSLDFPRLGALIQRNLFQFKSDSR